MNPIVYAIPVFGLSIFLEAWIAHRRRADVYDIADAVSSLQHGVLSQIANAFTTLLSLGVYVAVYERYRAGSWPMSSALAWILALAVYDFFYYWFHRLSHEVAVLWAAHVVHHSSEHYNLTTALRQSSTSALLGWLFYLPMAVAGVPPLMFAVVAVINLLYQYWPHTQLIGRLGWIDRVFVTPSNHRVHHGQNDYCMDVNYGGILIVWDRLFGTYADERADEPVCYGVRKPLASCNPLWGNAQTYADLWRRSRAAPGWRDALQVWLAPPAGWPSEAVEHFDPQRFTRYDPHTPGAVRLYTAAQLAVLSVLLMHFLAVFQRLAALPAAAYGLLLTLGLLSLGGLLEGRGWAKWLEQARLVILGTALAAQPQWFGSDTPAALRVAGAAWAIAGAVWLSRQTIAPAAPRGASA